MGLAFATAGTDAVPARAHGEAAHTAAPTAGSAAAALPSACVGPALERPSPVSSRHPAHLLDELPSRVHDSSAKTASGLRAIRAFRPEAAGHRRGASGGQLAPLERFNCLTYDAR